MAPDASAPDRGPAAWTISVEALAWAGGVLLFLGLRVGVTWQAAVGGAELPAVSGAWQAVAGVDDERFLPTLFQALTALLFEIDGNEVLPRVVAFAATATIPLAIYLLRPLLGAAGALMVLLLMALDGPAIYLGVAATVSGFDLAIVAWLFVALTRGEGAGALPAWSWALAAFALATAGALVLPLVVAMAIRAPLSIERERRTRLVVGAAAAVVGVVAASVGYGYGWQGVTVAPFQAFATIYTDAPSTTTAAEVLLLYSWPVVAAGILYGLHLVGRGDERSRLTSPDWLLLTWAGVATAWLVTGLAQHSLVPLVAASFPLSLIAGPGIIRALTAARHADWYLARYILPAAALMAIVGLAYSVDWARVDQVGSAGDVLRVVALFAAAAAALAVLAVDERSRTALFVPAVVLGGVVLTVGAFGIGLSASSEPVPSPVSPLQARVLRSLALEAAAEHGGPIVVHPDYRDDVAWPFRDSGDLLIASRVPDDAAIVLWPPALPQPDGFLPIEGEWALRDTVDPPTGSALELLRWYTDRNSLAISGDPIAVYSRDE